MFKRYVNRTCMCACLSSKLCDVRTIYAHNMNESHMLVYRYLHVINAVSML